MQFTDAMDPEVPTSSPRASREHAAGPPRAVLGPNGRVVSVGERDGDRIWLVFCHLWPLIGCFTGALPLIWLGPVVVWIIRKDESPLIDDQGRELINSMLTLLLLLVIPVIGWVVGLIWIPVWLVNSIRGAIHGSRAEYFRYPMTIRFLT